AARFDGPPRRERALRRALRAATRTPRSAEAHQALGRRRRHRGGRASAHVAALVRLPRPAIVRRPARGAGDAGPCEHRLDAGVHAPRLPAPRQGLRRRASARAAREARNQGLRDMPATRVTPVTVLTGFLGSGKSTLANALVRDPRFADTAVIVNEWGEIAIDHALVRESSENVVVLAGGCVCCRVAGDLVARLRE